MPAVHDCVFAQQDDLAEAHADASLRQPVEARGLVGRCRFPDIGQNLLGLPHLDFAALEHALQHFVEVLGGSTRSLDHAARVQRHVAGLDPVGGERPERGKVLRQADGRHDLGKLRGSLHAKQAQVHGDAGVRLQRATDYADLHGHFDAAPEVAGIVFPPFGQRTVPAMAGGVGMGTRLDGPPVVTGRQRHGIHAVHDALVVGGGPVGIGVREISGNDHAIPHPLTGITPASQVSDGQSDFRPRQGAVCQV